MENLSNHLYTPFTFLFQSAERLYWLYLTSAFILAFLVYSHSRSKEEVFSIKALLRFCFPRETYFHRSARIDYIYFIINKIVFALLFLPFTLAVFPGAAALSGFVLKTFWHFPVLDVNNAITVRVVWTVTSVIAMDFGLYLAHYLQHRIPFLWEFHKVHHSAEVLTPITAYRMHPVDDILSYLLSGFFSGIIYGVLNYIAPGNVSIIAVAGLNLLLFVFYVVGFNLRHTHIWLSYGPILNRLFISPAMHQIHHSNEKRHIDKNFGYIFSFWDVFFHTLYLPKGKESFSLGLHHQEHREYNGVFQLFFLPFKKNIAKSSVIGKLSLLLTIFTLLFFSFESLARRPMPSNPTKTVSMHHLSTQAYSLIEKFTPRSVFLEDLTWPEVQMMIQGGKSTVIIPSGGTEQNGFHMILGKHNYVVRYTAEAIAKRLGNALVAPVISYVPEGNIAPPTGHMQYPGTISIPEPVFESVLESAARSLKAHGFSTICFIGDHGGDQQSQEKVARKLNQEWEREGIQVIHVNAYYSQDNGQEKWLEKHGNSPKEIGEHAGILDTSELLHVNPSGIRQALLHLHSDSQSGLPDRASADKGRILLSLKVDAAVKQIQALTSTYKRSRTERQGALKQ